MKPITLNEKRSGWLSAGLVWLSLALAFGLASCGGGGSDAAESSVSSIVASPTRYSQTMVVSVSGRNLGSVVEMTVDGPCVNITRIASNSEDAAQWTCVVNGLGDLVPRIRQTVTRRELGSVRVNIPTPRVSMTLSDGTRSGPVVLELDPLAAPSTVDNFLAYVASGFYRSTLIHRTFSTVGILGGAFTADAGNAGALLAKPATRPAFTPNNNAGQLNLRGTIAMVRDANAAPATTQFFINTADNEKFDIGGVDTPQGPVLFPNVVFGRVVEGLAVVNEAAIVPTGTEQTLRLDNVPVTPITITAISQTR